MTLRAILLTALLAVPAHADPIRLATTTSTDNSGLLQYLLPKFEAQNEYKVRVIAVGTGRALRLGERGDVDALLVHAPASEEAFVAAGHGVERRMVMANDFVIVGPKDDPAAIQNATSPADAFARIAAAGSLFVSRGDDSGTHKKELELWRAAGADVAAAAWRREVGQGMGRSLLIADELQSYLLIDRGTWLYHRADIELALLYEGGDALLNPYHAIAVNPARHDINHRGARALIDWLTSPAAQRAIADYQVHGAQLFRPAAQ